MSSIELPSAIAGSTLAPVLADLGVDSGALRRLGTGGPPAPRLFLTRPEAEPEADFNAGRLDTELGERDAFLLFAPGTPADAELARWRNALWPLLHVIALYRCGPDGIQREILQGRERLTAEAVERGIVVVARRRTYVMSPHATVEKFDRTAPAWDGEPGGPGYPHFRWMRRYVGCFARPERGSRILDFGCGAGWVGIEAAKRCPESELCAFDPSPEMVRIAAENARREGIAHFTARTGFGESPPFPAAGEPRFDLVISSGVISFSPDSERWLDGLASTIQPGGKLVIGDIHRQSRGFRARRRKRPLLPARELNAFTREEVAEALGARGFLLERVSGYQLTYPIPQALHLNEQRLRGALTYPLLFANRTSAILDRILGSPAQDQFDSWVMRMRRRQ